MSYPVGQCTAYIAQRYPGISTGLGNAKDWFSNAKKLGYPTLSKPAAGTVVVYGPGNGYNGTFGHVANVDTVNADGTFNVSEMNYNGWNYIDQRRSTMRGVIGFIVPPGSSLYSTGFAGLGTAARAASQLPAPENNACVTQGPFGMCLDAGIGGVAMGAGGFIMLSGIMVILATAMRGSRVGAASAGAVQTIASPIRGIASVRTARRERQATEAKEGAASEYTESMRRATLRNARARARTAEAGARTARAPKKPEVVEQVAA